MKKAFVLFFTGLVAAACTAAYNPLDDYEEVTRVPVINAPATQPAGAATLNQESIEQGQYIVELTGCPACHTPGALSGDPDFDRWLAGSDVGIAYSNPMKYDDPGVVFPPNLTPDPETGIGSRSDEYIADTIREGLSRHGPRRLLVMPWLAYSKLSDTDTAAVIAYLRSLPPMKHKVPDYVEPGTRTDKPFVHFGIYRSRP